MLVTSATFPLQQESNEPVVWQMLKFVFILGLHIALIAWLASARPHVEAQESEPIRMDVRTIAMAPSWAPAMPKPVIQSTQPPTRIPKPVARHPEPVVSPPILVAAPSTELAPATFSAASPSPAFPKAIDSPAPTGSSSVTAARFDADYLQNPPPIYPAMSRKLQEEGKVLLQVKVTATGTAEQVQIKRSSGYPRLDEAALNTVLRWRFVPARQGSEVIASNVVVPIVFRLDS